MADECPLDRCPEILRNNDQCEPRCNIAACDFDNGDCNNNGGAVVDTTGDGLIRVVFFAVLAIGGFMLISGVCRSYWLTYSPKLGMSPWDRVLVFLRLRTREQITGEPMGPDGTEDNEEEARDEDVPMADNVRMAQEVARRNALMNSRMEEIEAEEDERLGILPVADAASLASSRLPEAVEYSSQVSGSDNDEGSLAGYEEDGNNEVLRVEIDNSSNNGV